jgi:hypothetical protein
MEAHHLASRFHLNAELFKALRVEARMRHRLFERRSGLVLN